MTATSTVIHRMRPAPARAEVGAAAAAPEVREAPADPAAASVAPAALVDREAEAAEPAVPVAAAAAASADREAEAAVEDSEAAPIREAAPAVVALVEAVTQAPAVAVVEA